MGQPAPRSCVLLRRGLLWQRKRPTVSPAQETAGQTLACLRTLPDVPSRYHVRRSGRHGRNSWSTSSEEQQSMCWPLRARHRSHPSKTQPQSHVAWNINTTWKSHIIRVKCTGKANIQVPSGSLRPALASLIGEQVNLRNSVIDFNKFYWPAPSQYEQISLSECFIGQEERLWFLTTAFRQVPDLVFQAGVLPRCPAPTTVLQVLLPPPTQATSSPRKHTQPHGRWFVTPQSSVWLQFSNTIWTI